MICRLAAAFVMLAGTAQAESGTIVFARFNAVYQQPAGGGEAAKIAELPDDATEVRWIEPTRDGRLVVLDMTSFAVWLLSNGPDQPAKLQGGGCTGRAHPSPSGDSVVCPSADGPAVVGSWRPDRIVLPGTLDEAQFRGDSGFDLAGLTDEGVIGLDRRHPDDRQVLANPGARSHLLIAPNGELAVAVFGEGAEGRVRSFHLDGKGASRQLGGPGLPVVWSWDSTWVMFQEGDIKNAPAPGNGDDNGALEAPADPWLLAAPARKPPVKRGGRRPPPVPSPPTTRVCVARATGGEVKCWDSFTGMAFSPDSTAVLLKRDKSLYLGKIAGVRPDPPVKLIDDVDGAATWTPGAIAAPMPESKPPTKDFEL